MPNNIDIGQPGDLPVAPTPCPKWVMPDIINRVNDQYPLQKNHNEPYRYWATGRSAGCPLPSAQNHSISNNIIEATGRSPLPIFGIAFLPTIFYDLK
jgi:hypothetical protein